MTNAIDNARNVLKRYDDLFPPQPLGMETQLVTALCDLLDSLEYEYGYVSATSWEYDQGFAAKVSNSLESARYMEKSGYLVIRRIKAGEWEKVS